MHPIRLSGWRPALLEDLVVLQRGFDITKEQQKHGNIPVISSSGVTSFHSEAKVDGPGVVIGRKGSLGTVHYVDGPYWPHDTTLWGKDFKGNNPRFVFYFLQTLHLDRYDVGNSNPTLNRNHIHRLKIFLPEKRLQAKIVEVLSAYDDMIENNRRRIQLLEESARLVYKEWFVRLRFPGHEHVKIVDGVPEGWKKFLISEVCETVGGGTPSTKIAENWNGEIEWIVPTDVTKNDCLFLLESERRITDKGLRESSAKMVPPWTILMTSRASVGYFGLTDKEVCTNQGFINIIPFDDDFRMYILFNLMDRVNEIRANAKGTTYPEISKGQFRNMSVVLPPKLLAIQFGTVVFSVIQQIRCLKKATQRLDSARDLLLPRLMNGEIAV
jgi:type I restriction enzyme S subunit